MKKEANFVNLLRKLMIMENGYTENEANALIKKHPKIIVQGIMRGSFALRAIVMALKMKEENEKENHRYFIEIEKKDRSGGFLIPRNDKGSKEIINELLKDPENILKSQRGGTQKS